MYICYSEDELRFVFENCSLPNIKEHDRLLCLNRFKQNNIMYLFHDGNDYDYTMCWTTHCDNKCPSSTNGKTCFNNKNIQKVYVKQLIRTKKLERLCK